MKSRLTTLCYIERDNQYLMLHRISKKNDVNKDKWIGVGGHFEEGESWRRPDLPLPLTDSGELLPLSVRIIPPSICAFIPVMHLREL